MKTKIISYKGKEYNVKEFALTYGIGYSTVLAKLNKEESIDSIISASRNKRTTIKYKKKIYTIEELCKYSNIEFEYFVKKLSEGFTASEIIKEYNYNNKVDNISDNDDELNNNSSFELKTIDDNDKANNTFINNEAENICSNEIQQIHKYSPNDEWDLLEKLSKIKIPFIKGINLIDYENVENCHDLLKEFLDEGNINIFFFNGNIYANSYYKLISNSKSYNFSVITLKTESQLVDHLLMYYLGLLCTVTENNVKINIISKDSHFYKVREEIHDNRVHNIGMTYVQDKDLRYIYSLTDYIIKNKYINDETCIFKSEVSTIFKNFFKMRNKPLTDKFINNLIDTLIENKFVEHYPETATYSEYFKFNMDNVKKENLRLKNTRA